MLTTVGAGGLITSVSGCIGSSGPDRPDFEVNPDAPARLMLLAGSGPDEDTTYGDEFSITAVIANSGGQPLNTEADVEAFSPGSDVESQSSTVVVEELSSGGTTEVTVGPFDASRAGSWEFRGGDGFDDTHEDFDLAVDVASAETPLGESFDHPTGLRFTPEELTLERGYHYTETERPTLFNTNEVTALQSPASEQVIAHLSMTVENRGTEAISANENSYERNYNLLEQTAFGFNHGSVYPVRNATFEGTDVRNLELDAGESGTFYVLSAVDVADLDDLMGTIGYADDESSPEVVITDLNPSTSLPSFEFVEVDIPAERREGDQEFAITVENTGDAAGTFRGAVRWLGDDDEWYHLTPALEADIEPGETATTTTITNVDVDARTFEYRIDPFDERFTF